MLIITSSENDRKIVTMITMTIVVK